MPNWCNNELVIKHEDKEKIQSLEEVVRNYIEGGEEGKFFGHILPEPEYEENEKGGRFENMPAWWNWRNENWGTKWDASFGDNSSGYSPVKGSMIEQDGSLCLNFDTAWAPPFGVVAELIKQGFHVELTYMEQGMDFWGWEINGEVIADSETLVGISEYSVDCFGNTYAEWDKLPDGAIGKGVVKEKEVEFANGNKYPFKTYEHDWEFDEGRSKIKAQQLGITEEVWERCNLAEIRGG